MKHDSHPGNHWRRTVDQFESSTELLSMLQLQEIDPASILWIRFSSNSDSLDLPATGFHYFEITTESVNEVINREIKGMEHPVVVIEGMPDCIDDIEHPEMMWQARRQLYLCTSRATAFLYFVIRQEEDNQGIYNEIDSLTSQLREPVPVNQKGKLLPETWSLQFQWRPEDIIGVPDFEDSKPDAVEMAEIEEAEIELADTES
ncbi:MAG: hypothetical protein P1V20_05120, partial [Verrucomicrobiales bacterium]|nr:hypothetical protein [Verrucomicrobiales bacterium]